MTMIGSGIGTGTTELARSRALQSRAISVRNALDKASTEMTTGEKQDRFAASGGNLTRLFALEQSLGRNTVYGQTISLTEQRLTMMQAVLTQIEGPSNRLAVDLANAGGLKDVAAMSIHAATARGELAATVGLLNTQVAGQSLFAGAATDTAALESADVILADIDALAGADAATTIANIDAYFAAPGGGFFARYSGSDTNLAAVTIGDGQKVDYGIQAVAPELVAVLRGQAMAAVIGGGASGLPEDEKLALAAAAGAALLDGKEQILDLSSRVASNQERVERAKASRVAERETLELAQADIIGVDPLEAASRYQSLETQLNAIYTITSRLLSLRFINFMS